MMVVLAGIAGSSTAHAAGLLVADGGFGGVLEIKEHAVRVTINYGVAVTAVDQVFVNTETRQVEALYTFPVPAGASVANFSMWIDGQEMVGEVVEKKRARQIYESYKQRKRDPGLLEQTDYKTFEMRIFPIGPGAEQRIQVTYYQELNYDHDWATFVYPLATVTRPAIDERITNRFSLTVQVLSEVPIIKMESPSHPDEFVFSEHDESFYEASLETPEGSLNRDVVVAYHLSRPQTGVDVITSHRNGEDGYFCMTITAGEELADLVTGMDYVFVLDISGSMGKERKLETSADAVAAFIEALGSDDRFEVMAFNVQPETLFSALQVVDDTTIRQAIEFLDTRNAKGGTVLQPAISTAYKYADPDGDRPLNVVVLSDGLTKQSERVELLDLIRARPGNTRVFCIGVGNEVNRPLLEEMAEGAGGLAAHLSHGDNFDRQAQAFRRKLTRPVATDLAVEFTGARVYDVVPEELPNLYHGAPVRLYGRYKGAGSGQVIINANVNGHGLDQALAIDWPAVDENNPEIERMWAWHKAQRLLKLADRTGRRSDAIDEIVRLGEGYSIATEYTSFLVLENNAEYERWKIRRRNALRIEQDRTVQRALRTELDSIRMAAADRLGPVQETKEDIPGPQAKRSSQSVRGPQPTQIARRSTPGQNWNMPAMGAGAIDPVTGGIACGLAALAALTRRKKK